MVRKDWNSGYTNYLSCRGRKVFEPPRYMTVAQAAEQLLKAIDNRRKDDENDKQLKCM